MCFEGEILLNKMRERVELNGGSAERKEDDQRPNPIFKLFCIYDPFTCDLSCVQIK